VVNCTTVTCRISSRLKRYKNCKNWSRLAKVIVKNKMSRFLWFTVYYLNTTDIFTFWCFGLYQTFIRRSLFSSASCHGSDATWQDIGRTFGSACSCPRRPSFRIGTASLIQEAVHIQKEGRQSLNRDKGSYTLSHTYDRFLDMSHLYRGKKRKKKWTSFFWWRSLIETEISKGKNCWLCWGNSIFCNNYPSEECFMSLLEQI